MKSSSLKGVVPVPEYLTARVNSLLSSSTLWDNHGCMPLRPGDHRFLPELRRYRNSGATVVSLNIGFGSLSLEHHIKQIADLRSWLKARSDEFVIVKSVDDIDRAKRNKQLGVFFDVEGMAILDDGDHGAIELLRDLGVGWMLVAYNENNKAGGGCRGLDTGLTSYGRTVLKEMKRVGMMVCCSHTGHKTALEVCEAAENPVIFSHSNPSQVHAHYRNIPDELIRAVAEVNGVIGINGVGEFLGDGEDFAALLASHIDYVVQLVGPQHVGLGLDYVFDRQELIDYIESMPETFGEAPDHEALLRFAPPEVYPSLIARLIEYGYDDTSIASILGGNWRRVAAQVWRT